MFTATSHFNNVTTCNSYSFLYRAWQRKLHNVVQKEEHRAEMYACLWMLIAEQDKNKFQELQDLFVNYWEGKETQFITYYQKEYSNRTGVNSKLHKIQYKSNKSIHF